MYVGNDEGCYQEEVGGVKVYPNRRPAKCSLAH